MTQRLGRLRDLRWLGVLVIVGAVAYVVSQIHIGLALGEHRTTLIQLQTCLTWQSCDRAFQTLGADRYFDHMGWDTLHPFIYGGTLTLWAAWVLRRFDASAGYNRLLWLPVHVAALDLLENSLHGWAFYHVPDPVPGAVFAAATVAAMSKWLLAITCLLGCLVGSVFPRRR